MASITIPLGKDEGTLSRTLKGYVHLTEEGKLHIDKATGAWFLFNDTDGRTLVRVDEQMGRRVDNLTPMLHMIVGAMSVYLGTLLN